MPQFLYRLQPTRVEMLTAGPTDREAAIVGEHFEYLQKLVAEGVVFMAGRTQNIGERTFGIVIFGAPTETAAVELMQNDPAVKQGVMKAELFPYRVALWSSKAPAD
ncbi:MAG: YciI family protein [Limisphaerales bacterium]